MRLSQYVTENGIDPFNFQDFLFVGSKLTLDPSRLVLVGGQAIETWGHYFNVLPPTGDHAPLTEDTDFLGSGKDAIWLCKLLGKENTELILNTVSDPSPNTAVAYIERPDGRVLLLDFLRAVVGLKNDEIVKLAVPISVAGVKFNVLHPLLCLESRLANLHKLPSKRNTNGEMQARWAVEIVEAYLLKMRSTGATDRDMIKACAEIAESAEYRSGPHCFLHHGIDPLAAVSPAVLKAVGGRFVVDDWPRRTERIARARESLKARGQTLISYKVSLTTADASAQPTGPAPIVPAVVPRRPL